MNDARSRRPPGWFQRRYLREFAVAAALWVVAIVARHYALEHGWWPLGFALLPAIPVALIIVAMLRLLTNMDELQRQIQLYAFAFAALTTAFVSVVCALLEDVAVVRVSIWIVWPLIIGLWGIASKVLAWHYGRARAE